MRVLRYLILTSGFAAFLLLPQPARAQVAVGFSGGLSIAELTGDDVDDDNLDSRTGFLVGGWASFPLSDILSLTSGLYYVQKGAEDAEQGVDVTLKLDYLEVPVLLQVGVFESERTAFSLFAGPAIAFEIGCKIEGSGGGVDASVDCEDAGLEDIEIETKSVTFDAIFGAGIRVMTSETMFLLGNAGLDLGLSSIDDSVDEGDVKNSNWFFQVGAGWIVGG